MTLIIAAVLIMTIVVLASSVPWQMVVPLALLIAGVVDEALKRRK